MFVFDSYEKPRARFFEDEFHGGGERNVVARVLLIYLPGLCQRAGAHTANAYAEPYRLLVNIYIFVIDHRQQQRKRRRRRRRRIVT